ncbi:MAG TPA: TIGR02444 family protein [Caulobacteraceae bacterium]
MRLWDYALAAWRRPGVSETALELQDRHGQCVPLLLWRAWATADGRRIDGGCLEAAVSIARAWEPEIIAPLRRARRALGKTPEGPDDGAIQRLRQAVRASELDAEKALLEALEGLTPPPSGAEGDLAQLLAGLMETWNGHQAAAVARDLAASLG